MRRGTRRDVTRGGSGVSPRFDNVPSLALQVVLAFAAAGATAAADNDAAPSHLVFWKSGGVIVHVEVVFSTHNPVLSIGAKGGGRFVQTIEDAIRNNAFIKIRPVFGRRWPSGSDMAIAGFVDPFRIARLEDDPWNSPS